MAFAAAPPPPRWLGSWASTLSGWRSVASTCFRPPSTRAGSRPFISSATSLRSRSASRSSAVRCGARREKASSECAAATSWWARLARLVIKTPRAKPTMKAPTTVGSIAPEPFMPTARGELTAGGWLLSLSSPSLPLSLTLTLLSLSLPRSLSNFDSLDYPMRTEYGRTPQHYFSF
eukprot:scaffold52997_cov35-Tisochrysis_lutea.AAC.1